MPSPRPAALAAELRDLAEDLRARRKLVMPTVSNEDHAARLELLGEAARHLEAQADPGCWPDVATLPERFRLWAGALGAFPYHQAMLVEGAELIESVWPEGVPVVGSEGF